MCPPPKPNAFHFHFPTVLNVLNLNIFRDAKPLCFGKGKGKKKKKKEEKKARREESGRRILEKCFSREES